MPPPWHRPVDRGGLAVFSSAGSRSLKERVRIFFNAYPRSGAKATEILEAAGIPDCTKPVPPEHTLHAYRGITLPSTDRRLGELRHLLSCEGIEWSERRDVRYTDMELRHSPLLQLRVTSTPRGRGGPTWGTRYDLATGCPQCGTGAIQISPLYLKPTELPKHGDIFSTELGDILVSNSLAESIEEANITGVELRQARASRIEKPLTWWQLLAIQHLPPIAPETTGQVIWNQCPICQRDGFFFDDPEQPLQLHYRRDVVNVDALPVVVATWERSGNSHLKLSLEESVFAPGLLLVKPAVFELFRDNKVRGVSFLPVTIE